MSKKSISYNRYCCYRHFIQGKSSKDATYCYSHVPLGVINPKPQQKKRQTQKNIGNMKIQSNKFRIQNRTHDFNEIQHQSSLPKRLTGPRIYIQKLVPKGTHMPYSLQSTKQLIIKKRFYESEYDILFGFFKKIGKNMKEISKQALYSLVIKFMQINNLDIYEKSLVLKQQDFINLMVSNFSYSEGQAKQFWKIIYNDRRFKFSKEISAQNLKEGISVKAFIYNFQKFYIQQTKKFSNMLSQPALKQRVIDIRHFLHDWNKKNIFYKLKMKKLKLLQFQICQYLRKFGSDGQIDSENLYGKVTETLERRNYQYLKIRTIAKFIYELTDNRYLSLEKIEQKIAQKIQRQSLIIQICLKVVRNFMQIKEYTSEEMFPITQILQFMKLEKAKDFQLQLMSKFLRRLIKYLYFHKINSADNQFGINFDKISLKFQCNQIVHVSPLILAQYSNYLKQHSQIVSSILMDSFMNYLSHQIYPTAQQIVEKNQLQNLQKIKVLECNYIAQGIKRFLYNCDLSCFWVLNKMTEYQNYERICQQGQVRLIKQIFEKKVRIGNDSVEMKQTMKQLFILESDQYLYTNNQEFQDKQAKILGQKFQNYRNAANIAIEVANQLKKPQINKQENQKITNETQKPELLSLTNQNQNNIVMKSQFPDQFHDCATNHHRLCCSKVSEQTKSTITVVQNLEDKLFDLLGL